MLVTLFCWSCSVASQVLLTQVGIRQGALTHTTGGFARRHRHSRPAPQRWEQSLPMSCSVLHSASHMALTATRRKANGMHYVHNIQSFINCPLLGPGRCFTFVILYTVGRTPWKGDQPVARPRYTHRTAPTQNKRTQISMPRVGFEPTTLALKRAKTVHTWDYTQLWPADTQYYISKINTFISYR
jgi:hypothetical protein